MGSISFVNRFLASGKRPSSRKVLLSACILCLTACSPETHPANHAKVPTDQELVQAYTYLYGRYLVLQQENHDINDEKVGYNKIKYNPLGSAQFVNPNLDVAYLESWIAVDADHAVILNVPEIHGRYYTAQLLNGWGEVVANVNERTFPRTPYGKFALILKGTHPPCRRMRSESMFLAPRPRCWRGSS
jgi:hypothetical protein